MGLKDRLVGQTIFKVVHDKSFKMPRGRVDSSLLSARSSGLGSYQTGSINRGENGSIHMFEEHKVNTEFKTPGQISL